MRAACLLLFALFACTTAPPAARRPNLILFLVDDLGYRDTEVPFGGDALGPVGHFRTPNLLTLCAEGTRFDDAYACCVCTPTRVSLLTGANAARHGVTNWTQRMDTATDGAHATLRAAAWNVNGLSPDPTVPRAFCSATLPQRLATAGYRTILVGKAHFGAAGTKGADPLQLGFQRNVAGHAAGAPGSYFGEDDYRGSDAYWNVPGLERWHGTPTFLTEALTQEALREIDDALASGAPFYLHFAHYAVHVPLAADPRFVARYRALGLDEKEAKYASMVEGVDASLGAVLAHLHARGIADDTLVVFMSDNGGLSATGRGGAPHTHNAPLKSGKGSAYEGGLRVPFAVRWPGHAPAGAVRRAPVAAEDLCATFCAAAGIDAACADGRSWLPLLDSDAHVERDRALVWHYPNVWGPTGPGIDPFSAIRAGNDKLIWFYADGRAELYDVANDPGEQHDLAATRPERVAALRGELRARLTAMGALWPSRKDGGVVALP